MLQHPLLKPIVVTLLFTCSTEKILAQSIPVQPISKQIFQSNHLSRLQRSVKKPVQENHDRSGAGDDPALASPAAKTIKAPNFVTDGFVRWTYHPAQSPVINTAPFQETVIHLEAGEHYTNISSGDPNRWSYAVAVSGVGQHQQQHVLIKPSLPQICTNLVITTDRRLYQLQLVSHTNQPVTRAVSFLYPPNHLLQSIDALDELSNKQILYNKTANSHQEIHFNYQLSRANLFGSAPSWWPKQVFDDGEKTYIAFPETMHQQDLPILFILNHGERELVNYRFNDHHFVVDHIFEEAELVSGVGQSEVGVLIRRS